MHALHEDSYLAQQSERHSRNLSPLTTFSDVELSWTKIDGIMSKHNKSLGYDSLQSRFGIIHTCLAKCGRQHALLQGADQETLPNGEMHRRES